ncbi:hypothetical protein Tco_1354071 [Tanacetum coccineum]
MYQMRLSMRSGDDKVERSTTTTASLDAEQASGGSPRCQEAIGGSIAQTRIDNYYVTTLSKKVESLEADLKQTKKVYGDAYTKLIKKRILQNKEEKKEIDQDARVTLVTPTHSQEDQPKDQLGVFSAAKVLADAAKENVHTYTRRRWVVSTSSGTAGMVQEQEQERLGHEAAVRLQRGIKMKEEIQRMAIVMKQLNLLLSKMGKH